MTSLSKRSRKALSGSFRSLFALLPMLLAVIGLVRLFQATVTPQMLYTIFNGGVIHDTIAGTLVGGVAVGQPFFSYIIGGELLKEGVSLYAVTAFILAWVTFGIVQLPLEWSLFGGPPHNYSQPSQPPLCTADSLCHRRNTGSTLMKREQAPKQQNRSG